MIHDAPAQETPHELLATTQVLTRRVRSTQRGTWFPLLVLGAITLAAAPLERYGRLARTCTTHPVGRVVRGCFVYPATWFIYWPIAFVFAYAAIAAFYFYRSRRRGVGTPIRPYVIAGVIIAALVTLHAWWDFSNPFGAAQQLLTFQAPYLARLLTPIPAIGLGLLVLAWVERNRALLVFALAYLVVVLVPIDFGWVMARSWVFLPHLVSAGGLLLLGAAAFAVAFAVAERTRRQA